MKVCIKCGLPKEDSDFRGKRNDCRLCCNQYTKDHYKKNKSDYIRRARRFNDNQKKENRKRLLDFLKGKSCIDCSNGDIRVLEFDHKERSSKKGNVADLINRYRWSVVLKEIEKCDIRCANCHRIKTTNESRNLTRKKSVV
jgi:hypothetical protein